MARKRKRARSSGGNRQPKHARNYKSRTKDSLPTGHSSVKTVFTRRGEEIHTSPRSLSARSRAIQVLRDLRSDPTLTFSQAAENRGVKRETVHKYVSSALRRDKSGRLKAKPSDRFSVTLQIPSNTPGESLPIKTKNNEERQVIGRWLAALNDARDGDFSLIRAFPRGQMIGGVLLPTGAFQIQRLLEALENADAKFEGPYKAFSARSA